MGGFDANWASSVLTVNRTSHYFAKVSKGLLTVAGAFVASVLLVVLQRRIRSLRMALRVSRSLHAESRAGAVSSERYTAFDRRMGSLSADSVLDERTWDDLHLDAVFRHCDHTASQVGRQMLYHTLRRAALTPTEASMFDARARAFDADPVVAGQVRAVLSTLQDPAAADLEAACFGELPPRPWFWWIFPVLSVCAAVTLIGGAWWPTLWIGALAIGVCNMIAQMFYRPRVAPLLPALRDLPNFLRTSAQLGRIPLPTFVQECDTLRMGVTRLRAVGTATRWLRVDALGGNELANSIQEYVNILFLLDLNAFVFAVETLRGERALLQAMFRSMGAIDVALSVASWRTECGAWSTPTFAPLTKQLRARAMRHPLVRDCVPNDLTVEDQSLLITGSNMSGKTTFIRALAVNVVLAQALATVCADEWHAPVLRVRSSIGLSDSLLEGKSYYLAEIESVRRMIEAKAEGIQHLFVIDELFRGTNTNERVAAAIATLSWLNRGDDLVAVATHDLEVFEPLGSHYAAYHFREQLDASTLSFDYRLYPGLSSTTNAIALLEALHFPDELIAHARSTLGPDTNRPGLSVTNHPG